MKGDLLVIIFEYLSGVQRDVPLDGPLAFMCDLNEERRGAARGQAVGDEH
jgi:hypothetical protein